VLTLYEAGLLRRVLFRLGATLFFGGWALMFVAAAHTGVWAWLAFGSIVGGIVLCWLTVDGPPGPGWPT
jgi:NADH:ubiquinone oxidoreductase subunit H